MVKRRLALAFIAAVLVAIAGPAQAATVAYISTPTLTANTWSGTGQTTVTLNTNTITPPTPYSNRLMLVVVTMKFASGPISDASSYDVTGTFGAADLLPAAKTGAAGTATTAAVWIGYVKDADLSAQALSVTIASKGINVTGASVYATFFSGVSQQWATADGSSVNSNTATAAVPAAGAVYGPAGGAFLAAAGSPAVAPNLPTPTTFTSVVSATTAVASQVAYKLTASTVSESTSVGGTAPLALASISLNPDTYSGVGDGTPYSLAPMVALLNPGDGEFVSQGSSGFKVQARVARPTGGSNITSAEVTWDAWATSTAMTWDPKYGGTQDQSGIWSKTLPAGTTGTGAKTIQVRAANTAGTVKSRPISITVVDSGGDGNLLVRDNSSQLCSDCHTHPLHSSETAGNTLGSWSIVCRDCHTPHGTKNIFLIPAQITPPSFAKPAVMKTFTFYTTTGFATNGFLNSTFSGVCQNCHTRTTDTVGNPMFRNNAGYDTSHNAAQPCGDCHSHVKGFQRPAVVACYDCHGKNNRTDGMPNAQVPPNDTCGNTVGSKTGSSSPFNRVGAHEEHVGSKTKLHLKTSFGCTECHPSSPGVWHDTGTTANKCQAPSTQRANGGNFGPYWGPIATTGGVTPTYNYTTQTCAATYCHGNFPKSGITSSVTWNTAVSCGACHRNTGGTSASPTYPHPLRTDLTGSTCGGGSAGDCHPSGVPSGTTATHANGILNQTTFGCSQCHGELATAGPNGVLLSSPTNAAPGATAPSTTSKDVAGNTATSGSGVAVGAHLAHLRKTNLRSTPIACGECHALPPLQADTGHATGTSLLGQGSRATLSFGTLAKGQTDPWSPAVTPTYSSLTATGGAAGSCGTLYCHGAFLNNGTGKPQNWSGAWVSSTTPCASLPCPTGTTLTCVSCHGSGTDSAPTTNGAHPVGQRGCGCHGAAYTWDGTTGTVDKNTHVNGKKEGGCPGAGGPPTCLQSGCHAAGVGNRRNVSADFTLTLADGTPGSHHVGKGGSTSFMGTSSALTEKDCQVCHAEYDHVANTTSALHCNGLIDLRDVDNPYAFYQYDPSSFKNSPGTANSWNLTWRLEQSGQTTDVVGSPTTCTATSPWTSCKKGLDRFCLGCHDADGASAIGATNPNLGDPGASPRNPFYDNSAGVAVISNERDEQNRATSRAGMPPPGITDIASRVADSWRTSTGTTYTAVDRDANFTPVPAVLAGSAIRSAAGLTRNDPPEGVFSRHAIRGLSQSVYANTTNNLDGGGGVLCYPTGNLSSCFAAVNGSQWASNSVMDCADCHTVDGANTTNGNAHGSKSEYLLKNGTGNAIAETSTANVNCARCHNATYYVGGKHTNNAGDWQPSYTSRGSARMGTKVQIYGYECGNCHGGGPASKAGATLPTPASNGGVATYGYGGFGTIHGTSQVFGTDALGNTGYRDAYRFLNGNSMRYYIAGDWVSNTGTVARQCVTLTTNDTSWGGCSVHSGPGGPTQNNKPPMNRALAY